jgi:hypothetical protein
MPEPSIVEIPDRHLCAVPTSEIDLERRCHLSEKSEEARPIQSRF